MSPPVDLEDLNRQQIENGESPFLIEAIIPYKSKAVIKNELSYLGVHGGTIRPELEYQSEYFKRPHEKTV